MSFNNKHQNRFNNQILFRSVSIDSHNGPSVTNAPKHSIEIVKNQNQSVSIKKPLVFTKADGQITEPSRAQTPSVTFNRPISPQNHVNQPVFVGHPNVRPLSPNIHMPSYSAQNSYSQQFQTGLNIFSSIPQIPNNPLPETYSKYSLNSFVSTFLHKPDFNETNLSSLGIDLETDQPLLPLIHSMLSDYPMFQNSRMEFPKSYKNIQPPPSDKMWSLTEETLLLIFFTQPGPQQAQAANELINKFHYTWDNEHSVWKLPTGATWDVDKWMQIPSSCGEIEITSNEF